MNIVPLSKSEQASFLNEYFRDTFWNKFSRACKIKDSGFHKIFDTGWFFLTGTPLKNLSVNWDPPKNSKCGKKLKYSTFLGGPSWDTLTFFHTCDF